METVRDYVTKESGSLSLGHYQQIVSENVQLAVENASLKAEIKEKDEMLDKMLLKAFEKKENFVLKEPTVKIKVNKTLVKFVASNQEIASTSIGSIASSEDPKPGNSQNDEEPISSYQKRRRLPSPDTDDDSQISDEPQSSGVKRRKVEPAKYKYVPPKQEERQEPSNNSDIVSFDTPQSADNVDSTLQNSTVDTTTSSEDSYSTNSSKDNTNSDKLEETGASTSPTPSVDNIDESNTGNIIDRVSNCEILDEKDSNDESKMLQKTKSVIRASSKDQVNEYENGTKSKIATSVPNSSRPPPPSSGYLKEDLKLSSVDSSVDKEKMKDIEVDTKEDGESATNRGIDNDPNLSHQKEEEEEFCMDLSPEKDAFFFETQSVKETDVGSKKDVPEIVVMPSTSSGSVSRKITKIRFSQDQDHRSSVSSTQKRQYKPPKNTQKTHSDRNWLNNYAREKAAKIRKAAKDAMKRKDEDQAEIDAYEAEIGPHLLRPISFKIPKYDKITNNNTNNKTDDNLNFESAKYCPDCYGDLPCNCTDTSNN